MTTSPTISDPGLLEFHQGDRMRKALAYAGMTVSDMCAYLEVSDATISRWLGAKGPVKRANLRLWAMRCGVQLEWLETGNGPAVGTADPSQQLPRLDSNQQPSGYPFALVTGGAA